MHLLVEFAIVDLGNVKHGFAEAAGLFADRDHIEKQVRKKILRAQGHGKGGAIDDGLARPVVDRRVPKEAATVMLAVDVSASMEATDVSPSRIEAAKSAAETFVKGLPDGFQVGLIAFLGKNGSRLGGNTGQYLLRWLGCDTFIFSGDMVLALKDAGLDIADNPSSKKDLAAIQAQMNPWAR